MPDELWTEVHDIVQEMQKSKWLSEEALQIAVKRREAESKGEKEKKKKKGKIFPFECRVPKYSKER